MPRPLRILLQVLSSLLLVSIALMIAIGAAFQIDQVFCGDSNGSLAAGGGAALGMFVIFYVGLPTIVFCVVSELISNFWLVQLHYRFMLLAFPAVAGSVFMGVVSRSLCTA